MKNRHDWLIGVMCDIEDYARVNQLTIIQKGTTKLIETTILQINSMFETASNVVDLTTYRNREISPEARKVLSTWIDRP